MKKFNDYTILKESSLKDMFDFPELDILSSSDSVKLNKIFQQRDNLIEDVVDGSISISEWMDFGSVNSFSALIDSEKLLIRLLTRAGKLTKKEKLILDLTNQILHIFNTIKR